MARCKGCIHDKVCNMWAVDSGIPFVNADTCEHYKPTADVAPKSEVEGLERLRAELSEEVETLKDSNEHLAVMLEEAKDEASRYKRYFYRHDYDNMIAEVLDEAIRVVYSKTDMKIYNTIDGKPLGDAVEYGKQISMYDVITLLAELKKKYTEDKK